MTTSNFSPSCSNLGSRSNTSAHWKVTRSSKPFKREFSVAWSTASWEASTPGLFLDPAIPAFKAKEPVWVKQSNTLQVSDCGTGSVLQDGCILIQEKSGFLAVFYVYDVVNAIFTYLHLGIKWFTNKALEALHTFLKADFCIASLINATDQNTVFCQDFLLIYLRSLALSGRFPVPGTLLLKHLQTYR